MKNLKNSEIYQTVGGMGWYPGYNAEDHINGTSKVFGAMIGFVVGFAEGFWNQALDEA